MIHLSLGGPLVSQRFFHLNDSCCWISFWIQGSSPWPACNHGAMISNTDVPFPRLQCFISFCNSPFTISIQFNIIYIISISKERYMDRVWLRISGCKLQAFQTSYDVWIPPGQGDHPHPQRRMKGAGPWKHGAFGLPAMVKNVVICCVRCVWTSNQFEWKISYELIIYTPIYIIKSWNHRIIKSSNYHHHPTYFNTPFTTSIHLISIS